MSELVSIREYARRRGVDDKTIRKAVAAGKIAKVAGKIDPEAADRSWLENRDGSQPSALAEGIERQQPAETGDGPLFRSADAGPVEGTRASAELRKELAKAEIAEIQALERKGAVVMVTEVQQALGTMVTKVRTRALMISRKLGAKFGPAVEREAEKLITSALSEFSEYRPDDEAA